MTKAAAMASKPPLILVRQPDESEDAAKARNSLRPAVQAAMTAHDLLTPTWGDMDLASLIDEVGKLVTATNGGDFARVEAMLTVQAGTLDMLFNRLARQAVLNIGSFPGAVETYLKLALRARSTAEALHQMKRPGPVAFVQQANVAHGPQ